MLRIFLVILTLWGFPASAQILWSDVDEVITVTVRPGWRSQDGRHLAGLEFQLAPGWKTYWRSPGAAGIAPQFTWRGTKNVDGLALHWPTPGVFLTAGYRSLGYKSGFVLPIELTAVDAAAPIRLRGTIEIGVCLDICLPAKVRIDALLPVPGAQDAKIKSAMATRPSAGRGQVVCRVRPSDSGLILSARIPQRSALGNSEAVAVELAHAQDRIWITDTQVRRVGPTLHTTTEFMRPGNTPITFDRSALRFTVVGARGAVEYFGCISG